MTVGLYDEPVYQSTMGTLHSFSPLFEVALFYHRNTRGRPMTFRKNPSLVEMYKDFPFIEGADVQKAVQTGVSELFIQLALERSGWNGSIVAYVLPTYLIRNRFVQSRIDPLLASVPEYRIRCPGGLPPVKGKMDDKDVDNLRMKKFGKGRMLFLGSNTATEFLEFSADIMIVDELDRCDQGNLTLAKDRLRESDNPQMFRLSNPTYPGVGIATCLELSDGRRWFIRCTKCKHWQNLDWFVHFVEQDEAGMWVARDSKNLHDPTRGDIRPLCSKCHDFFDRSPVGCWVPERHGASRRGYTMSRLEVLSQDCRELFQEWIDAQKDTQRLQAFYNSILGKPFTPFGSSITVSDIQSAAVGPPAYLTDILPPQDARICAGIDVGKLLNVQLDYTEVVEEEEEPEELSPVERIDDPFAIKTFERRQQEEKQDEVDSAIIGSFTKQHVRRHTFWAGTLRSFEDLADLLVRKKVEIAVIDAMPETRKCQELRDKFRETGEMVIWLSQFYPTARVGSDAYGMRLDHNSSTVRIDRTQLLDATMDELRCGDHILPSDIMSLESWVDQMTAPMRILNENKDRYVWDEGNKDDHYRFAGAYSRVAFDLLFRGGSFFVM